MKLKFQAIKTEVSVYINYCETILLWFNWLYMHIERADCMGQNIVFIAEQKRIANTARLRNCFEFIVR